MRGERTNEPRGRSGRPYNKISAKKKKEEEEEEATGPSFLSFFLSFFFFPINRVIAVDGPIHSGELSKDDRRSWCVLPPPPPFENVTQYKLRAVVFYRVEAGTTGQLYELLCVLLSAADYTRIRSNILSFSSLFIHSSIGISPFLISIRLSNIFFF